MPTTDARQPLSSPTTEGRGLSATREAPRRSSALRLTRRGRLTITLTVTVLLLVAAATTYLVTRTRVGAALGLHVGPACDLHTSAGDLHWSAEEAMTATTVAAVGVRIGATDNGVAAAVRRSLAGRTDADLGPARARQVYRALPDRAHPSPAALATARALLGADGPALTCTVATRTSGAGHGVETPTATGLTPRADTLRRGMRAAFGRQSLGGFDPRGVTSGHIAGSAHYEGRAIDVFFRPINAANTRLGWVQAQWAVAHAERLHVATVIFDKQVWSAQRSSSGWRDYAYPDGPTDNPVLLHEDHVHVDVARTGTFG